MQAAGKPAPGRNWLLAAALALTAALVIRHTPADASPWLQGILAGSGAAAVAAAALTALWGPHTCTTPTGLGTLGGALLGGLLYTAAVEMGAGPGPGLLGVAASFALPQAAVAAAAGTAMGALAAQIPPLRRRLIPLSQQSAALSTGLGRGLQRAAGWSRQAASAALAALGRMIRDGRLWRWLRQGLTYAGQNVVEYISSRLNQGRPIRLGAVLGAALRGFLRGLLTRTQSLRLPVFPFAGRRSREGGSG